MLPRGALGAAQPLSSTLCGSGSPCPRTPPSPRASLTPVLVLPGASFFLRCSGAYGFGPKSEAFLREHLFPRAQQPFSSSSSRPGALPVPFLVNGSPLPPGPSGLLPPVSLARGGEGRRRSRRSDLFPFFFFRSVVARIYNTCDGGVHLSISRAYNWFTYRSLVCSTEREWA